MKIKHRSHNEVVTLHPPVKVSKMLGNGLRTILAETVTVTVYPDFTHLHMRGRSVLRNGGHGRTQELGWVVSAQDDVYFIDIDLSPEVEAVLAAVLEATGLDA